MRLLPMPNNQVSAASNAVLGYPGIPVRCMWVRARAPRTTQLLPCNPRRLGTRTMKRAAVNRKSLSRLMYMLTCVCKGGWMEPA